MKGREQEYVAISMWRMDRGSLTHFLIILFLLAFHEQLQHFQFLLKSFST